MCKDGVVNIGFPDALEMYFYLRKYGISDAFPGNFGCGNIHCSSSVQNSLLRAWDVTICGSSINSKLIRISSQRYDTDLLQLQY